VHVSCGDVHGGGVRALRQHGERRHLRARGSANQEFPGLSLDRRGAVAQDGRDTIDVAGLRGWHAPSVQRRSAQGHGVASIGQRLTSVGTAVPMNSLSHRALKQTCFAHHPTHADAARIAHDQFPADHLLRAEAGVLEPQFQITAGPTGGRNIGNVERRLELFVVRQLAARRDKSRGIVLIRSGTSVQ
jgi:hypothetical protein